MPVPGPPPLHACVVMDYQNMHLVGHDSYASADHLALHETLLDPLLFGERVIAARNAAQGPGHRRAILDRVLVYRGLPVSEYDPVNNARSQRQKVQWERSGRVKVHYRPLRYELERGADRQPIRDVNGNVKILETKEKGIDVLCALAVVRESQRRDVDVVILASHDTDLIPALDEGIDLNQSKVETVRWQPNEQDRYTNTLRPTKPRRQIWTTRLSEQDFIASRDHTYYP